MRAAIAGLFTSALLAFAGGFSSTTPSAPPAVGESNGLTVSGSTLSLSAASATDAGAVTTGAQTIAGAKTFTGITATFSADAGVIVNSVYASTPALSIPQNTYLDLDNRSAGVTGKLYFDGTYINAGSNVKVPLLVVTGGSISPNASTVLSLKGSPANGATAKAVRIASVNNLTTAGAKVITFENNNGGTELASITQFGGFNLVGMTTTARDALAGADLVAGTIIFNTTTKKLNFYTGTAWEAVTSL